MTEHALTSPSAQPATITLGVFGAIASASGALLLVRRASSDMWCLPGGLLDGGESIAACLERECREEVGLTVRPKSLVGLYSDPRRHLFRAGTPDAVHFVTVVLRADVDDGDLTPQAGEVAAAAWFARDRLPVLVPSHRVWIHDAFSRNGAPFLR